MVLPANLSYNLAIIFPVFRELVNVLNNYCFYTENMLLDKKIYIKKNIYIYIYIYI